MKRENIKRAAEIESEIEKLEKELNAWEVSKTFNGSSIVQIRKEPYMQSKYFTIDLNSIPFKDLRNQFLESLNYRIDCLNVELQNLLER